MKISELTKIESNIGFLCGVLVGVIASWVLVVFFTKMQWYFKVFTSIGQISIMGILVFSLMETIKMRKNYILTMKEMEKVNKEANAVINKKVNYV